jgi:hypothetical protein
MPPSKKEEGQENFPDLDYHSTASIPSLLSATSTNPFS